MHRYTRVLVSAAATAAIVAGGMTATGAPAQAAGLQVLVYNDPNYVDAGTAADLAAMDYDHEGINEQTAITAAGNVVSTVDTTSAAAFSAALAGKQVFVIPQTENGDLGANLDAATIQVVRDFVNAGGVVIVNDDYWDQSLTQASNLNALFGYSIAYPISMRATYTKTADPGAAFTAGPNTLPYNDDVEPFDITTLPAGAVPAYTAPENPGNYPATAAVFSVAYGSGKVIYLGWDWFDAAPADPAGQDGGWNTVLAEAVAAYVAPANPTPNPTPTPTAAATDTTAPDTILTRFPSRRMHKRLAEFSFKSNEQRVTFQCSIDGHAFRFCTSEVAQNFHRGRHTFQVRAVDAAGNVDPTSAKASWRFVPIRHHKKHAK